MKAIELGENAVYFVPEGYAEASEKQRLVFAMASIVPVERRDRIFWEYLVKNGLGCSERFWKKLRLSVEQWFGLCKQFEWIFGVKCEVRPCESFCIDGVTYFLPAPGLDDTDALDFSVAAVWFMEMAEAEDNVTALHKLMAVLCRPRRGDLVSFQASDKWDGDIREVYNEQRAGERAKIFEKADVGLKVAFLQWWEFEFKNFVQAYEGLFGKGKEEPRYADGRGWLMVLKHVAAKAYLGKLDDVHGKNVHDVWSYMLDDVMDSKEQQKD